MLIAALRFHFFLSLKSYAVGYLVCAFGFRIAYLEIKALLIRLRPVRIPIPSRTVEAVFASSDVHPKPVLAVFNDSSHLFSCVESYKIPFFSLCDPSNKRRNKALLILIRICSMSH